LELKQWALERQEEHVVSSSTNWSSNSGCESTTISQEEDNTVVDASEASYSYLFGPSTIAVSSIQEMASLHYIAEGDVGAPGEENIPEPIDDRVVVFEEFFVVELWMPP
jgi:hypothetical protein